MTCRTLLDKKALSALWGVFNGIVFSNSLALQPLIEVHSNKHIINYLDYTGEKRILGYFINEDKPTIILNRDKISDTNELIATLVHEMVHQYQDQIDHTDKQHGCEYQRWRRKIKRRHNIDI